jgi:hypothetical protein
MVAGIKNVFCLLQAIFSMSETSVAASKKIGWLPEKIGLLLMILGKTGSILYFLKTWLGTRCPLLSCSLSQKTSITDIVLKSDIGTY